MHRTIRLLIGVVPTIFTASGAYAEPPTPGAAAVESFLERSVPICIAAPAQDCINVGWAHTDANADERLSADELDRVRGAVTEWFAWRRDDLTRYEQSVLTVGIGLVNAIGVERLITSYDSNGDGLIDRAEALADIVQLDDRPLGQVIVDPEAVDRAGLAQRLGALSPMLGRLLGQDSR